jgi:hypothetical protein
LSSVTGILRRADRWGDNDQGAQKVYNIQDVCVFHLCGMDGSFAMASVKK